MTVRRPPQPRSHRPSGHGDAQHARSSQSATAGEHGAGHTAIPQKDVHGSARRGATNETRRFVHTSGRPVRRKRISATDTQQTPTKPNISEREARRHAAQRHSGNKTDWALAWEGEKKSHQLSLRAAAVLGFAALGALIVINPLRAFIAQQEQIRDLNAQVQTSKDHIEELEESIALWNDPAYVQAQARERLGYVMPGQTLYVVTGGDADPQKRTQEKVDKANEARRAITPFYVTMWDSIAVAGQAAGSENPQNVPVINGDLAEENSDGAPSGKPDGGKADNSQETPADTPANNGDE